MKERAKLERQYTVARSNLLAMTVFSAINVVLLLADANLSFLFSATFPALAVQMGLMFGRNVMGGAFFAAGFIVVGLYGVFYLLSKSAKPLMLAALILFALDTVLLLWILTLGFDAGILIDVAFHGWVLWYLGRGVQAWLKLKKLPDDAPPPWGPTAPEPHGGDWNEPGPES